MAIFSPNKHRKGNLQRMLPPVGWRIKVQVLQIFPKTQESRKKNKKINKKCQPGRFWHLLSAYINFTSCNLSCAITQHPCLHRPVAPGCTLVCHRSLMSVAASSFPEWTGAVKVRTVTASLPHFTTSFELEAFVSCIDPFCLLQAVQVLVQSARMGGELLANCVMDRDGLGRGMGFVWTKRVQRDAAQRTKLTPAENNPQKHLPGCCLWYVCLMAVILN